MIKKSFFKNFFWMHMFFLAWKRQFWQPFLKWFNEKTKKSYLEVRKNMKNKNFCKKILLIGHLETNSAHMTTLLQIFRRKSENFSPKGGIYFKKPTMFSSKCSSGHVKCFFDDSVENFRQSSMSFGSKCIFDDCWKISARSSINFAWKTKLYWKTNTFLMKTPQKVLGTLKMQFQQKWRNFFSNLVCFSLEYEVKKNMRIIHKKTEKILRTRRMHVWKRCWNFSPEVRTIIAQSPRTFEIFRKYDNLSQSSPLDT